MIGLATRNAIYEAAHGDAPSLPSMTEDEDYAFRNGRASDKVKATTFELPRHPFMPPMDTLGTPREFDRKQQERREAIWVKCFGAGIALILGLLALSCYHFFIDARPKATAPVHSDDFHYRQHAMTLAVGKSIYLTDPHERCLVGLHKDAEGQVFVTHYC